MKKITSYTIHATEEGERASFVYCNIDNTGDIIDQNLRGEVVLVDDDILSAAGKIYDFLQSKISE